MNLLRIWGTRKFFSIAAIFYLLFFILFFFAQGNRLPDSSIVFMQTLGMGFLVFFSLLYDKQSIYKTILVVAMFQLICCFGLRYFNMDYFNDPLGYRPADSLLYHRYASHIELSLVGYIKYLNVLEEKPDVERMREAAEHLQGEHDYKSFCGNSHMKKSTVRVVDTIRIEESGNWIRIYFHGSGFLQNMVRILTGTLLEVGYGRLSPEDCGAILEAKDRKKAGPTAPAQGLCLMKVDY